MDAKAKRNLERKLKGERIKWINEIRAAGPSMAFTLRGQSAFAVLLEPQADIPHSAFAASRPLVAVYGAEQIGDDGVPGLLGTVETAKLERQPRGRGTRIQIYPKAPWSTLHGEQVERLIDLVRGVSLRPRPRSRASALSADNPSFKRLTQAAA